MTTADTLTVTGLRVHAHHGVFASEREAGQPFVIDLTAWYDMAPAAGGDDLAQTVNYAELVVDVADAVRKDPVDLIETVAERVASVALARDRIDAVSVTIHKPAAPIPEDFADVSVTILRRRHEPTDGRR